MATPRTTRARSRQTTPAPEPAGPVLPGINTRNLNAYGTRGSANLNRQAAEHGASLDQGFTTARAVPDMSPLLEGDEDELPAMPSFSRQGTVVDSMAHYEGSNRSVSTQASRTRKRKQSFVQPQTAAPVAADPTDPTDPTDPENPHTLAVFFRSIPRYIGRYLLAFLLGALFFAIFAAAPLPEYAAAPRDHFFRHAKMAVGLPGYDPPPNHLEKLWMYVRYNSFLKEEMQGMPEIKSPLLQAGVNTRLRTLISEIEANQTALDEKFTALEDYLPPMMVVDVVDGEPRIKEEFWHALSDKLQGSDVLYDAFVKSQEASTKEIVPSAIDAYIESSVVDKRILSRESTLELLAQNARELEQRIDSRLEIVSRDTASAARLIAAEVATEIALSKSADIETSLPALVRSNMLLNSYDALSAVNWFNPNLGVIVDPHHTSPTAMKQVTPKGNWFSRWSAAPLKRRALPPVHALAPWTEEGDCWCAAESPGMGKAQLAIMTEDKIFPTRFVVEHPPKGGVMDPWAAPKYVQLWAELNTAESAEMFKEEVLHQVYSSWDMRACSDFGEMPPTETSVCVGQGMYDLHSDNWVQSFPTIADGARIDLAVDKFYYRATENWGSNKTCTYRVRLHGKKQ